VRGRDRKNIGRPKAIWNVGGEANETKGLAWKRADADGDGDGTRTNKKS